MHGSKPAPHDYDVNKSWDYLDGKSGPAHMMAGARLMGRPTPARMPFPFEKVSTAALFPAFAAKLTPGGVSVGVRRHVRQDRDVRCNGFLRVSRVVRTRREDVCAYRGPSESHNRSLVK